MERSRRNVRGSAPSAVLVLPRVARAAAAPLHRMCSVADPTDSTSWDAVSAAKIRAARPAVKVLCVSGTTRNIMVRHGILDGGVRCLAKPFTTDELSRKVREILGLA